jgi:hypothetical protein
MHIFDDQEFMNLLQVFNRQFACGLFELSAVPSDQLQLVTIMTEEFNAVQNLVWGKPFEHDLSGSAILRQSYAGGVANTIVSCEEFIQVFAIDAFSFVGDHDSCTSITTTSSGETSRTR